MSWGGRDTIQLSTPKLPPAAQAWAKLSSRSGDLPKSKAANSGGGKTILPDAICPTPVILMLRKQALSPGTLEKEIHHEGCPSVTCFPLHSSCSLALPDLLSSRQPAMSSSASCHPRPELPWVPECLCTIIRALCLCESLPRYHPSSLGLTITLLSRSLPDSIQRMPNRELACLMGPRALPLKH